MQQGEHRGELRDDRVVVIAGVGDQRFRQRRALSRDVAVDAGDILGLGPRDIAERTTGGARRLLPAHPPEAKLGASIVGRRIERIEMGRADRSAAVEGFEPERDAARIAGARAKLSRHRQRNGGQHQVVRNELQQIGVARGDRRILPAMQRRIAVRGPCDFRIHPPRQAVHQSTDILQMGRRLQRIDAECAKALRCARRAEEVTEAGSRSALYGSTVYRTASGLLSPHGSSIGTPRVAITNFSPRIGKRACWACREIIVIFSAKF